MASSLVEVLLGEDGTLGERALSEFTKRLGRMHGDCGSRLAHYDALAERIEPGLPTALAAAS